MERHCSGSIKSIVTSTKPAGSRKSAAKPGFPDDFDAIAALPDNWIPRHSGPILANYLKKREQDHQNLLADMDKCTAAANHDIDEKIRKLAENFLVHVNQNQIDIDCIVDTSIGKKSSTKVDDEKVLERVNKLCLERIDDIASFKQEASAIEKERAEKLKIIIRDKFHRLISVGHMLPKDLLHNFDERIYEINQQLLSNSRAFVELEAQLRVQLDRSIVNARSSLFQLFMGIGKLFKRHDSASAVHHSTEKTIPQRSRSVDRELSSTEVGRSILGNVEELDACISNVVKAYRAAVLKVYNGFRDKLDNLESDLSGYQVINDTDQIQLRIDLSDFQKLLEHPLRPLSGINGINTSNKSFLEMTKADVISMQKSLYSLGERLQITYSILHDAGHLWDAHALRAAVAQKLTIAAVEDLVTSHDAMELASEIQISIAMEQLRWAPDVDKLQQQFDSLTMLLAKTADMYFKHSELEVGRLEEFMNLPTPMANTLLSEFEVFLEKYPRSVSLIDSRSNPDTPIAPIRSPSYLRLPLPRAIMQTELQELALKNWRNGFLESFAGNISMVPAELKRQSQLWVDERCTALHMRYSLKIISHNIRMERVKAAKEARLAELRLHAARLESHLLAIHDLIERVSVEASAFAAIDAPFLYPFVQRVEYILNSIDALTAQNPQNEQEKKLKMASYSLRLPKHRKFFEDSLDKAIADYKLHLEHRIQEARVANVRFMSHMQLLHEGGRYAVSEATRTSAALSKASDALEVCVQKAIDALNNRRIQLLIEADSIVQPVMQRLDNTSKLASKSFTKQQANKKKK